jgi:hypothetical protein
LFDCLVRTNVGIFKLLLFFVIIEANRKGC